MPVDLTTKTDLVSMRRYADMVASLQPSVAAYLRDAATEIERQVALLRRLNALCEAGIPGPNVDGTEIGKWSAGRIDALTEVHDLLQDLEER